jgi:fermentation-respiration switch protein FrsA (DUF1100 family)
MNKRFYYVVWAALIIFAVFFAAACYIYEVTLARTTPFNKSKAELDCSVFFGASPNTYVFAENLPPSSFMFDEAEPRQVNIKSFDGKNLYGVVYEKKEKTNKWAILIHGYKESGAQMLEIASRFYQLGCNVLLPDCRGHGLSEGDYIGMGWHDRLDIIGWTNEILKTNSSADIVLYGISMGGASVLMSTGEILPPNVKCAISDCSFTSAYDQFNYHSQRIFAAGGALFAEATSLICGIKAGYTLKEASAIGQVSKSVTPTLFIHGSGDDFVPVEMAYKLYEAASCPKELLIINGAGHGDSLIRNDKLYWGRISYFINKYLHRALYHMLKTHIQYHCAFSCPSGK